MSLSPKLSDPTNAWGFSLPKKISKGLKYNIETIFSEILGNVSVYLMSLISFNITLNVKRNQRYGLSEGTSESDMPCYLTRISIPYLLYVKRDENAMWQAPQGRSVQFFLPNRISRLCLYEKNKKDLIRFGRRQRVGVNAEAQNTVMYFKKTVLPSDRTELKRESGL
jgi:hypothetical protein